MLVIFNSRLGTIFRAIRDDETATEAAGINTTRYKLYAFMISAFFAGIAGSFYVLHIGKADYNIYSATMSFYPIIFTLIGGISLISGSVFGAYFFAITNLILDELFDFFAQINFFPEIFENLPVAFVALIFSIILLILIRFTKRGIMEPTIKHSKTLWELIIGK
jgi:ABC-type branched-subunit amino acid transport system permease subunit